MARIVFTQNIQRHVRCGPMSVQAANLREALEAFFAETPQARGYVLDDQGSLRRHVVVFVDGTPISDRAGLTDHIGEDAEIYVMQALSGG